MDVEEDSDQTSSSPADFVRIRYHGHLMEDIQRLHVSKVRVGKNLELLHSAIYNAVTRQHV